MTWCLAGSYVVVVDAEQIVRSALFAGAEISTFLAPALEVHRGLVALGEEAAALEHESTPRSFQGSLPGSRSASTLRRLLADGRAVAVHDDTLRERAVDGVVLQQMRERSRVGDVVDGDELEVGSGGRDRRAGRFVRCVRSR